MLTVSLARKNEFAPARWAGGETTQLFLYPQTADYNRRDFAFRISSAVVTLEESTFTLLPGFTRYLTPLQGTLRLEHEGHGAVELAPFQTARFDGGWTTRSYGKCTDFNLMLAEPWGGRIDAIGTGLFSLRSGFTGIYALADDITVFLVENGRSTREYTLCAGDFLLVHCSDENSVAVELEGADSGKISAVVAAVWEKNTI